MFCAQPTAQYGQTDLTTRSAVCVRAVISALLRDCAAAPSARRSGVVSCRTSEGRRGTTAIIYPDRRRVRAACRSPPDLFLAGAEPWRHPAQLVGRDHAVDEAVLERLLGREEAVAIHVVVDALDALAGVPGV